VSLSALVFSSVFWSWIGGLSEEVLSGFWSSDPFCSWILLAGIM